jgi:hypothetical protein
VHAFPAGVAPNVDGLQRGLAALADEARAMRPSLASWIHAIGSRAKHVGPFG